MCWKPTTHLRVFYGNIEEELREREIKTRTKLNLEMFMDALLIVGIYITKVFGVPKSMK